MTNPIPAPSRARPRPALAGFVPAGLALPALALAALVLAATTLAPGGAEAACVCRCVDGKAKAICASGTDIPPLCSNMACPLAAPRRTPLDTRDLPPPIKPGCTNKQVLNPANGQYEWAQICQ